MDKPHKRLIFQDSRLADYFLSKNAVHSHRPQSRIIAPVSHTRGAKPCGSVVDKPRKSLSAKHEKRLPVF
ncbi:Uncharacterized protein ChrSV_3731 [Chromobacterium vaccinii]|nr:Uncharacterized protein ChrSW_3731 [Chromobacterium vaccinii]QND91188.1 Uncharacterized protein ChrSV_3731 [Chromobacterium vaccinii]